MKAVFFLTFGYLVCVGSIVLIGVSAGWFLKRGWLSEANYELVMETCRAAIDDIPTVVIVLSVLWWSGVLLAPRYPF